MAAHAAAPVSARDRLIVALDLPTIEQARALVETLGDSVTFYKVGLGLQLAGGGEFARELKEKGKRIFLDYKYYDIEETIRNAVARAAERDIDFLTVHGTASILRAAVEGKGASSLKIFCVTVLTSIEAQDFQEIGYEHVDVNRLVIQRAVQAMRAGCDGVIASAREASQIRQAAGRELLIVTPGIRPAGTSRDDQKRTTTPREAVLAGSDYLVIGRPIIQAPDPVEAAERCIAEMAAASDSGGL
jgi:orotidine-5'-phosphate decarboxylase